MKGGGDLKIFSLGKGGASNNFSLRGGGGGGGGGCRKIVIIKVVWGALKIVSWEKKGYLDIKLSKLY